MREFATMIYTVVVPFHGSIDLLSPLLRALDNQQAESLPRVLVSDDASPQPIEPAVRELGLDRLDVEVIRSEANGGPGAARNRALGDIDTPWVAFLDGDTVPGPDWVKRLGTDLVSLEADVLEGVTLMQPGSVVTPFTHSTEAGPPDRHVGGNVVFRTDLLRSLGGFDERYFDPERRLHFREDADMAFRLEKAGATFAFDSELLVWHPPLEASFWTPVKLARRYYFDPLLHRDHPDEYAEMHSLRKIGPLSLRSARHHAATGFVAGLLLTLLGQLSGRSRLRRWGLVILAVAWPANAAALCFKRTVLPRDVPAIAAAGALAPLSYSWNYWRGVLTFRHRPRL